MLKKSSLAYEEIIIKDKTADIAVENYIYKPSGVRAYGLVH